MERNISSISRCYWHNIIFFWDITSSRSQRFKRLQILLNFFSAEVTTKKYSIFMQIFFLRDNTTKNTSHCITHINVWMMPTFAKENDTEECYAFWSLAHFNAGYDEKKGGGVGSWYAWRRQTSHCKFLIGKRHLHLLHHRLVVLLIIMNEKSISRLLLYHCIFKKKKYNENIDHYKVIMELLPGFFFALFFFTQRTKWRLPFFPFDRF